MTKRILIFSIAYDPFIGGAEVAIKNITDRLPDYEWTMVTPLYKKDLPHEEMVGNIRVVRVGWGNRFDKFILPFSACSRALALHKRQAFDGIWAMMANTAGLGALFFHWRSKLPYLLTLQEGDPEEYYLKRTWFWKPLWMQIFRKPKVVQVISKYLEERIRRYGYKGPLHVIPNGVNTAHFGAPITPEQRQAKRTEWGAGDDDTVIITTSRLSHKNGIDDLVNGFAQLTERSNSPATLIIAGSGEQQEMVEKLIAERGAADDIRLLGHVEHSELPLLLQSSDIFIRPSRSEGLGNSFLEAMVAGVPTVATPVGGIPDFLTDGETGVFCQPDDPSSIADAFERLMNDDQLCNHLRETGSKLVKEEYEWDLLAQKMDKVYMELLSK